MEWLSVCLWHDGFHVDADHAQYHHVDEHHLNASFGRPVFEFHVPVVEAQRQSTRLKLLDDFHCLTHGNGWEERYGQAEEVRRVCIASHHRLKNG